MDSTDPDYGRRVIVRPWRWYEMWARQLGEHHRATGVALKLRSGEHIVAAVLSAHLEEMPTEVDAAGGVDLVFGSPPTAAVEIKSLAGAWREHEARVELGGTHEVVAQSWRLMMPALEAAAQKAARQLASKLGPPSGHELKRYAVVFAFAFDFLAVEWANGGPLGSPELPPFGPVEADFVLVVYHPGLVQLWDVAQQRWTTLLAQVEPADVERRVLGPQLDTHHIEEAYLDGAGIGLGDSPFWGAVDSGIIGR